MSSLAIKEEEVDHHAVNEEEEEEEDESNSILALALASNQPIQISRIPKKTTSGQKNGANRMSIMGFTFGGQDEEEEPEDTITADPTSLQNMRRMAKAKQAAAAANRATSPTPPSRRGVRRAITSVDKARRDRNNSDDTATTATSLSSSAEGSAATPNKEKAVRAPRIKPSSRRPIARSKSEVPPPRNTIMGMSIMEQSSAVDWSGSGSNHGNGESNTNNNVQRNKFYNEHEDTIKRLTVHDDEIQKILQDPKAFAKLQKVLRKHGAVTNEVLKQVLPLYVKHQAAKEQQAQASQQQRQQAAAAAAAALENER